MCNSFQPLVTLLSLERSLTVKDHFKEFDDVIQEYFDLGHAEGGPHVRQGNASRRNLPSTNLCSQLSNSIDLSVNL